MYNGKVRCINEGKSDIFILNEIYEIKNRKRSK